MKYIEINTREVYLRREPKGGLVVRGEIPECGASCHASLSRVFLEYAMSCRGLEDPSQVQEAVHQFGEQLGEQLTASFKAPLQGSSSQDIVPVIFECVMTSLEGSFQQARTTDELSFTFQESPLASTAGRYGHRLWIKPAYQGFVAFFESILKSSGADWILLAPQAKDSDPSLQVVSLKKTT